MEELLKIAKEKYPVGTVFKSPYSGNIFTSTDIPKICITGKDVEVRCENGILAFLYENSTWAKIISKPKVKEMDMSEFLGLPTKEGVRLDFKYTESEHQPKKDNINPSHYSSGKIECIDAIESALSPEEFRGFLRGNIIKYNWRCMQKNGVEDLKKSMWYLDRLIRTLENGTSVA